MSINRSLLLENAIMFRDSTLIDNIHQSIIDLQLNPQKDQIQNLFNRTFSYLNNDLNYKTLEEIVFLILSCISQNNENKKEYINQIFENSKKKINNLVALSMLYPICKDLHIYPDSKQIINDMVKQIANQILHPKDKFTIFDLEINDIYKANLIADIVLTIKLPEKVESTFLPYIFSKDKLSQRKKVKILQKACVSNCVSYLPEILLTEKCIFDLFSQKNLSLIIPKMTKQTFFRILPFIKKNFSETKDWEESFSLSILEKCVEFNINFIFIYKMKQIFESIQKSVLKYSVFEYLIKNDANFSDKFSGKIVDWPINLSNLKTVKKLENIPINILVQNLYQIDDFELLERVSNVKFNFNDIIDIDVCSKKQFWIHIFNVISNSKQRCSKRLLNFLSVLFKKNLKPKNIYEMFDAMIFDKFPTNQYGNYFLFDFINKFNPKHKDYIVKKDKIIAKIIDQKTIPLMSFWNFFDSNFALQYINSKSINPKNYCLFSTEEIKTLTIQQNLSEFNQNLIIETLKTCDFTKLKNLDEEMMQFISNIIFYLSTQKEKEKIEIQGLTYDNILPFLALSLIYFKESGGSMLNISIEFDSVLFKSCELSSETNSLLNIESINLIMSLNQYIFDQSFFPSKIAFEMMNIFINQLIDNTYKADTIVLLQSIINLQKIHTNPNVQCLFDKNGFHFIKFIIQNMSKIEHFDKLKNNKFDLKIIDQDRLLNELISSTTNYDYTINAIYFLENFCINISNKISIISNKLVNLIKNTLKKNEFETFSFIYNFMAKNRLLINAKEIFSDFKLTNANTENFTKFILNRNQNLSKNMICEILYNILMKDTSIMMDYFSILFDKVSKNHILNPKNILKHYSEIYENNKQYFVKALKNSYVFHSDQSIFVKKFHNNQSKYLKSSQSIIMKLFDEANSGENDFQALFILNYIASYFPFLFINNPEKIFSTVLPKLTSISLLFSSSNDINNQSIKLNLLALSFLFSTLYSIRVLELFVPWILNNILSFNCSQILSFTFILLSLFKTKKVKDAMLSLMIKYNFVDIAYRLLEIEVPDEIFQIYQENVYKLLIEYYQNLNKLQHKKKLILIDELFNSKNPFKQIFDNNITIYPINLKPLNLPESHIEQISKFIKDINYFSSNNNKCHIDNNDVKHFLSNFQDINKLKKLDLLNIPQTDTIKSIRICTKKQNWVYEYIVKNKKFPLLNEQQRLLKKTINEIDSLNKNNLKEKEKKYDEIDVDYFFLNDFCKNDLFNLIIKEIDLNTNLFDVSVELLKSITRNKIAIQSFFDLIHIFISNNFNKTESIKRLIKTIDEAGILPNILFDTCENKLIDFALMPENRDDFEFISIVIKNMSILNEIPNRATHLIALSLLNDDNKDLVYIIEICRKMEQNNLKNIKAILENLVIKLIKNESESKELIESLLEAIPSLITLHLSSAPFILDKLINQYQNGNKKVIQSIYNIFNEITPERNSSNEIDISFDKSTYTPNRSHWSWYKINSAPQNLIDKNPEFWQLYSKYFEFINYILRDNEKNIKNFKFLIEYPELTDFEYRLSYFNKCMKKKINKKQNRYYVNRNNILNDSYQCLNRLTREEWLNDIRITFENENGIDLGGLTKEWFTLVAEELFNPDIALFSQTENNSYYPNRFSGINDEHIDYFRFAGKFVARALIQGQCICAHFTTSFRRQILHDQLKLKDMEDVDENIYKSMIDILEMDVEQLYYSFVIDDEKFGEHKTIPLKENGENIDLTNENKNEYVNLYINYKLRKSISQQVDAFIEGFNFLIPHDEIKMFTQSELDLIICGVPNIDINDMRANTKFLQPYHNDHPVIKMFFNVLSKWNPKNLGKFLLFLTGSSQVPVNGFKGYVDRDKQIKIGYRDDKNSFCVAHTCFNKLDLPPYENEDIMNSKLLIAIDQHEFVLS